MDVHRSQRPFQTGLAIKCRLATGAPFVKYRWVVIIQSGKPMSMTGILTFSSVVLGGRAFGPPLCGGIPPATPPSKTTPHRPFVLITAVRPNQSCGCQPNTQPDNLNGGEDEGPAKTDTVCRIVTTGKQKASLSSPELHERDASFQFSFQTCGGTVFQFHLTLNRVSHEGDCPHYRKVSQASSPARW